MNGSRFVVIPVVCLVVVATIAAICGCDSAMPKGANARLIVGTFQERTKGAGDIILVGRFNRQQQLDKRTKGDWITTRYLVVFDVVHVEQGQWPHATLAFVAADSGPTPESGIMVDSMPWPYRLGVTMRFELERPDRIVGQMPLPATQPKG